MIKKLTFTLGCIAVLASITSLAHADAITINLGGGVQTHINVQGLTAGPSKVLSVSDTTLNKSFSFLATYSFSTGPAVSYSATSSNLNAMLGGGGTLLVSSPLCGGPCLIGGLNYNAPYAGILHHNGSFQGLFDVTYVSPALTGLFGIGNSALPVGSYLLNTKGNTFSPNGTTATADVQTGQINFQTVPEPGTLALLGTGLMGFAAVARRILLRSVAN